jgi:hypothetical protein
MLACEKKVKKMKKRRGSKNQKEKERFKTPCRCFIVVSYHCHIKIIPNAFECLLRERRCHFCIAPIDISLG